MRISLLAILLMFFSVSRAQDPIFYSPGNLRLYNNPAMSGLNHGFSVDFGYRHQWANLPGDYVTSVTAFNQYLGKGNGVSLQLFTDNAANTTFKRQITLGYAKTIRLSGDHFLSVGTGLSYFQKRLDPSKLTFGGMIDPRRGYVYPTSGLGQYRTTVANVDLNAGVMYHSSFLYAGFAIKHITEPSQSFFINTTTSDVLPRMYFGEVGGKIEVGEDWEFIPHVEFRSQGSFQNFIGGVKVGWKKFYLDGGLQNAETFYSALGFDSEHFHCAYNLVTYRGFSTNETFFAHELYLGVDFVIFHKENEFFFDF